MDQCVKQVRIFGIEKKEYKEPGHIVSLIIVFCAAGNPWAAPDGWDTLRPQLNLNLDEDVNRYTLHGGAMHVTTEVIEPKKK